MGVYDRVEGRKLCDWKSCSDPGRYIRERSIGFQGELYALALAHAGIEIDIIEYRLIQKPTIKFCKKDATPEDYENRCLDWLTEKPERLVSHSHILTQSRMDQSRQFAWSCSKRILENRQHDRWLPTAQACYSWSRECEYMGLCQGVCDDADLTFIREMEYEQRDDPHEEIAVETSKDVLTYSSMSALCRCNAFYYWRYEAGLRRKQEHSDALYLGSAMHAGLDAYASGGLAEATVAIAEWAVLNPVLGEDATHKQEQELAKARAMVRAAARKWDI